MDQEDAVLAGRAFVAAGSPSTILKGSSDWYDWLFMIKTIAKKRHVWEYVNPNSDNRPPLLEMPVLPPVPIDPTPDNRAIYAMHKSNYDSLMKLYK